LPYKTNRTTLRNERQPQTEENEGKKTRRAKETIEGKNPNCDERKNEGRMRRGEKPSANRKDD
jgi:hypothetical protein